VTGRQEKTALRKELLLPEFDLSLALCAQTDPEIFFPIKGDQGAAQKAKDICRQCEVQKDCLAWAVANNEEFGIWGGLTPKERRGLRERGKPIKRLIPIVPR
jgi:hypothetical protein